MGCTPSFAICDSYSPHGKNRNRIRVINRRCEGALRKLTTVVKSADADKQTKSCIFNTDYYFITWFSKYKHISNQSLIGLINQKIVTTEKLE